MLRYLKYSANTLYCTPNCELHLHGKCKRILRKRTTKGWEFLADWYLINDIILFWSFLASDSKVKTQLFPTLLTPPIRTVKFPLHLTSFIEYLPKHEPFSK